MAESIDSLDEGIRNLSLEKKNRDLVCEGAHPSRNIAIPSEDLHDLPPTADAVVSDAQSTESGYHDLGNPFDEDAAAISPLRKSFKGLAKALCVSESFRLLTRDQTEDSIIRHLETLGSPSTTTSLGQIIIRQLLRLFNEQIRSIIQTILSNTDRGEISWRVGEECYKQAISPHGTLGYHGRKDRSDVHKNCRTALHAHAKNLNEEEIRKVQKIWIRFWVEVLDYSPGGPTLFFPQEISQINHPKYTTPKYLFRTFDRESSGINNEVIVESSATRYRFKLGRSNDLMSMEDSHATSLLHYHLDKKFSRERDEDDNLVSWTSSLLFAIQYALFRHHHSNLSEADIRICVVDTSQFPQGQFIRDLQLLDRYLPMAEDLGEPVLKFFKFRKYHGDYYNGEFLSQGVVRHAGRSCVVSLEQLQDAGLFKLYPEFGDPEGQGVWANRVKFLRCEWRDKNETTDKDMLHALNIARTCFHPFEANEIACLLLSFKNRELSGTVESPSEAPSWADKPVEVTRYWQAFKKLESLKKGRQHNVELREIFA